MYNHINKILFFEFHNEHICTCECLIKFFSAFFFFSFFLFFFISLFFFGTLSVDNLFSRVIVFILNIAFNITKSYSSNLLFFGSVSKILLKFSFTTTGKIEYFVRNITSFLSTASTKQIIKKEQSQK